VRYGGLVQAVKLTDAEMAVLAAIHNLFRDEHERERKASADTKPGRDAVLSKRKAATAG
jgi:hypothetical protein